MSSRAENLLIVADSDHDANMLYATGMFVPDPFIFLRLRGKDFIVMSDLEIDRARQQAPHCHVLSFSNYQKKLNARGIKQAGFAHVIQTILREKKIGLIFVPHNFPLGLATELQRLRVKIKVKPEFFSERELKSPGEVKKVSAALMMAEVGMAEAMQALKSAKVSRDRRLMYRGAPLTSEKLRSVIDCAILQAGGVAAHTIVAGGKQGCDPHETGHGQLFANELLILDIFPRSQKTGYFGDITRTVVRGRASEAARKLYDTVLRGQLQAFKKIRAGVPTAEIHQGILGLFEQEGYKTGRRNGRMQGFFHGTGHGLGLEIHEAPRIGSTSRGVLKAGQIVTVEPGLYYPEIGGVRIEDVALVTNRNARNLTQFEKVLEL
jgi:Xaa-Pro aminopeptidase